MRFVTRQPSDTAGFTWQPLTLPTEYAIATIVRPKASEVATKLPPVAPATPQATKTRTNVPIHSAIAFLNKLFIFLSSDKLFLFDNKKIKSLIYRVF